MAGEERGRQLTIDQVLDAAEAFIQCLPGLSPARRLGLKLCLQGGLAILRFLQGRLVALLLVSQLLGQAVTLLDQGSVLSILGTKGGLRFSELPPQVGVGL